MFVVECMRFSHPMGYCGVRGQPHRYLLYFFFTTFYRHPDSVNVIFILRQIMTVCGELRIREDRLA
jgi:hypothetical protein